MKITVKTTGYVFSEIKEGDMFFYHGDVFIKLFHNKNGYQYNAFQVGREDSNTNLFPATAVIPVTDLVAN